MKNTRAAGKKGEAIACRALERYGYDIVEKNYRCREGEIDIIARDKDCLCFIEVKSRSSESFGLPEESVTKTKQLRLWTVANVFLEEKEVEYDELRFDIAAVNLLTGEVRVIRNAFEVDTTSMELN
ncbi:MAG: YraN family protein [Candidatus Dadabacteria bacterium]|nr:YraN family protein [Candidatus Dadabacteria bacterium]